MERVSVVGITGSGKTTLARRLARILDCRFVELDSIYHQANWQVMEEDKFNAIVAESAAGERWVIDGSYAKWTAEGAIWRRADTVVWVRRPKLVTMHQLFWRSARNLLGRRKLWNDNRERLRDHVSLNPKRSIFAYVWKNYENYERQFTQYLRDPRFAHINFVVLRTQAEIDGWLEEVSREHHRAGLHLS